MEDMEADPLAVLEEAIDFLGLQLTDPRGKEVKHPPV